MDPRTCTLSLSNGSLDIDPVNIQDIDNIKQFYNKDNFNEMENLIDSINKRDKGLSIIYGCVGTGKTTSLNHILSNINRTSIFIPNNSIEMSVNSLPFRDFIKKYENPLLIIDDCEFLTNSQVSQMNYFTTNILQLVDGFLSNDVQILLIFNYKNIKSLDENLLRCNNLIKVLNIEKLNRKTATKLSKNLGINKTYKNETTLSDVFSEKTSNINKLGI